MYKFIPSFFILLALLISSARAASTDAELEEKLKAVMILFDKSQEGLKEEVQSLELQLTYLEEENAKLKDELESVRRQNLDLKSQLVVQEARGQSPGSQNDVVSSELVAANTLQEGGNQRQGRGAGAGANRAGAGGGRLGGGQALEEVPVEDMVNINEATREQLLELPLVNEFLADNIIAGRPWNSMEDLIQLQGFGPMKLRRLQIHAFAAPVSENPEETPSEKPVD